MPTKRLKPCTSHNKRHFWEWRRDVRFKNQKTRLMQSRGFYTCRWCGSENWGKPRSNL